LTQTKDPEEKDYSKELSTINLCKMDAEPFETMRMALIVAQCVPGS
jgi:hypothetical protein